MKMAMSESQKGISLLFFFAGLLEQKKTQREEKLRRADEIIEQKLHPNVQYQTHEQLTQLLLRVLC